jgi:serine/threonine protein kinase
MPVDGRRLKELFVAAAEMTATDRAAFLERECGTDVELRERVEALLKAHDAPGSFLADPVPMPMETHEEARPMPGTVAFLPSHAPGTVIAGRYTLVEKLGEGGMGEVWVAKQSEPVKRKVALKLIKTGMDSKAVLTRFEQERQALGLMDHPNIARVLDGGLTPTGQPFFVMELVNGLPLTRFCDEIKLTPRERMDLFVPICQAVQHAHQKGIIHRDLKPSNILVTVIDGKGVPKIIDFGVAKATAGRLTEESLSTQFGAVIGTLEYMAPEQAGFTGQDVDTRADIYSLGVILYELLTGLRPHEGKQLRQAAYAEILRILHEEEPSKPSTRLSTDDSLPSLAALRRTEPKKLMAMLRGELDWVVMKCLEKDRNRRYETASGWPATFNATWPMKRWKRVRRRWVIGRESSCAGTGAA